MSFHQQTINVYNNCAQDFEKYLESMGSRVIDIERALVLADSKTKVHAIEIGCGAGKDASDIISRVNFYQGSDPSRELLAIAKKNVYTGSFVLADALSYNYPQKINVIYAFDSLLHVNKEDLRIVFKKAQAALTNGGIFYLTLKEGPGYMHAVKSDRFGERLFYLYNTQIIKSICGQELQIVYESHQKIKDTDWFTIALKKYLI